MAPRKRWRFPKTRRAGLSVLALTALGGLVLIPLGLLFGPPIGGALFMWGSFLVMFAMICSPFLLLGGLWRDAVDEGIEHIEQRRVIKAREKHPIAGAISIAYDGGDVSDVDEDQTE